MAIILTLFKEMRKMSIFALKYARIMENTITKKRENNYCSQSVDLEASTADRLRSVEEFMTQLEQAVLERL